MGKSQGIMGKSQGITWGLVWGAVRRYKVGLRSQWSVQEPESLTDLRTPSSARWNAPKVPKGLNGNHICVPHAEIHGACKGTELPNTIGARRHMGRSLPKPVWIGAPKTTYM